MAAGTAVAATGGVTAGAFCFYERPDYQCNDCEKNNADDKCSHIMTPDIVIIGLDPIICT